MVEPKMGEEKFSKEKRTLKTLKRKPLQVNEKKSD